MERTGKNYKLTSLENIHESGRDTLHEKLSLTGSEISINELPAGVSVPFVHSHKMNEEVYIILQGNGQFYIDGEEFDIEEGNVIRVDAAGQRCIKADNDSMIKFICVQSKANSLTQFTKNDGTINEIKPSWLI